MKYLLVVFCLSFNVFGHFCQERPNIVFFFADDLGMNDVGYKNPHVVSPNIDELAHSGVILEDSYTQSLCSPSRHALLTGRYPFRDGMQHVVITNDRQACSNLSVPFVSKTLQENDYSTHLVGKWHLGFCNEACLPLNRGFDTFLGIHGSHGDPFEHIVDGDNFDLWNNTEPLVDYNGTYTTFLYTEEAVRTIEQHNTENPMFLFYSFQEPHTPLVEMKEYMDLYPDVDNEIRKMYLGLVSLMDEAIGNITDALKRKGMYDNTIIVFMSDNGGDVDYAGNNYPLRGEKSSQYEGGIRVPNLMSGGWVEKNSNEVNVTREGLFYIADWYPTLLAAAGIDTDSVEGLELDGVNQLSMILNGTESDRDEIIHNLDTASPNPNHIPYSGYAILRKGDYKLIWGFSGSKRDVWYQAQEVCQDENVTSTDCAALEEPYPTDGTEFNAQLFFRDLTMFYKQQEVQECIDDEMLLFNIREDPGERNNLANDMPEKLEELKNRLEELKNEVPYPVFPGPAPGAYPNKTLGTGWCTIEELEAAFAESRKAFADREKDNNRAPNPKTPCVPWSATTTTEASESSQAGSTTAIVSVVLFAYFISSIMMAWMK